MDLPLCSNGRSAQHDPHLAHICDPGRAFRRSQRDLTFDYARGTDCVPAAVYLCWMACWAPLAVCLLFGVAVDHYLRWDRYLNKFKLRYFDQPFFRSFPFEITALTVSSKKAWSIAEIVWLIYKASDLWPQVYQDLTNTEAIEQSAITLR